MKKGQYSVDVVDRIPIIRSTQINSSIALPVVYFLLLNLSLNYSYIHSFR